MRYANEQEILQAKEENPVIYQDHTARIETLDWETEGSARAIERRIKARLDEEAQKIAMINEQKRFDNAEKKKCPRCKGSGHYYAKTSLDTRCFKCGGKGIVYKNGEVSNWQR